MVALVFQPLNQHNYDNFYLALVVLDNQPQGVKCFAIKKERDISKDEKGRTVVSDDQVIASMGAIHGDQDFNAFAERVKIWNGMVAKMDDFCQQCSHAQISFR